MTSTETTTPASEKQINLIISLAGERGFDLAGLDTSALTGGRTGSASALITQLFAEKRATDGNTPAKLDVAEGFYRVDDDVVWVIISKSGNWYAKIAVKPVEGDGRKNLRWDYIGKRIDLRNAVKLDDAEAGRYLSFCVRCNAPLTDPDSIARGMGPICKDKV